MLDEQKIKLMTKMALYEQKEGKEDLRISAYYRNDYASLHTLYTVIWATIAYVCVIGVGCLCAMEYLMENLSTSLFVMVAGTIVAGYFLVLLVSIIVAYFHYNKKHEDARDRVKKFNHDIIRLLKMYEKENQ